MEVNIIYFIALHVFFVFQLSILNSTAFEKLNHFSLKKDQQIITDYTTSIGFMSKVSCAAKCSELFCCCKSSFEESTGECRIGTSGCCNLPSKDSSGIYAIHSMNVSGLVSGTLTVTNGVDQGDWSFPQYCYPGHYAIGYVVKVEDTFSTDYTGLNAIEIICGSRTGYACGERPTSGTSPWSDYNREVLCPEKTFLVSFGLQSEDYMGFFSDDSGPNWIRFTCRSRLTETGLRVIEATKTGLTLKGHYGGWSKRCPLGSVVCGIQTRIFPPVPVTSLDPDDLALTDVKFFCCT